MKMARRRRSPFREWVSSLLIIVVLCGWTVPIRADTPESFSDLKKKSLRIRNIDPDIRKESEWRSILSSLLSYAEKASAEEAPVALYNAAMLSRELYHHRRDDEDGERARSLFKRVYNDFPTASFADDALKELSEFEEAEGNPRRAKELLEELVKRYPVSELAEFARLRLKGEGGALARGSERAIVDARAPVVVVDPGHGGEDFGAVGVGGLYEKDVVLDVAFQMRELIERGKIARVILTRTTDEFVPLERRTQIANEENASLFVSLHTNASERGTLQGFEVYYLDNTDEKASLALAERENASGGSGGLDDVSFMLSDLIQSSKVPESKKFAEKIARFVPQYASKEKGGLKNLGVKKAPFYVLVGAHMPAALVEFYFINHPIEGAFLAERSFRAALARGMTAAIREKLGR